MKPDEQGTSPCSTRENSLVSFLTGKTSLDFRLLFFVCFNGHLTVWSVGMASVDGIKDYELDFDFEEDYGVASDEEQENYQAMGIDPETPTGAKPGSEEKVIMLAARYAAGLPLWHNEDCYDHGPGKALLAGLAGLGKVKEEAEA